VTPHYQDLDWTGLDFSEHAFDAVTSINPAAWRAELDLHTELFDKLAHNLPQALLDTRSLWAARLGA
jgi:phosphoenolpyruvate carboxykinase (GTP)